MLKMLTTSVTTLVFIFIHVFITNGVLSEQRDEQFFDRFNHETKTWTRCGITTCLPGTQIKPCVQNKTMDTCEDCPEGYEMLDNTTSSQDLFPCVKKEDCSDYAHTIDSTEENHCYSNDVHLPCKCDVKKGFCGDPCNCRRYHGNNCQPGEILHHRNCSCIRDPGTTTTTTTTTTTATTTTTGFYQNMSVNGSRTEPSKTVNLTSDPVTPQPSVSQNTNISSTSEGMSHSTPSSHPDTEKEVGAPLKCEDEVNWKTIGTTFGLLLLVIFLCLLVVGVIYKYRKEIKQSDVFKNWPCSSQYRQTSTNPI